MIWWWNFYQCLWFLGLSWWSKLDLMSRLSILDSENVPHETGVCYNTVFFLWPRNQFHLLYHSIDNMSVALTRFLTNQNAQKTVLGEDLKAWEIMLEFTSHALPQFLPQKMIDLVKNYQKAAFFDNLVPKLLSSSNYFNFWLFFFVSLSRTFPVNVVNLPYF